MTSHDHTNSGIFVSVMPGARMLKTVTMTLIAPDTDEMPSRWTARMVKSMPIPACNDSGELCRVQPPAAAPSPTPKKARKNGSNSMTAAGGRIQKPQLLTRGNAMSGAPIMSGIR